MSTSDEIEVVEYDDRWEAAQETFARRNWPTKSRRGNSTYLRWEYRGPDHGPVPGLLLAVAGDEVVGQIGLIPGQAMIEGELAPIQWLGNIMVDPSYRRRGVLTSLFTVGLDRPAVTLGTDPSAAAASGMAAVGFTPVPSSKLMVLPLVAGPVVATRYPKVRRAAPLVNAIGAPAIRHLTRRLRSAQHTDRAQVCTWADVTEALVESERGRSSLSVHDEAFLRWRCRGFAPWVRTVDAVRTPTGSFALLERGGERMLVLHWHAADDDEAAAVMGRAAYIAESYGASYVQAMATTPAEVDQLTRFGFRARRTPTELWCYPGGVLGAGVFTVQGYDTDQNL